MSENTNTNLSVKNSAAVPVTFDGEKSYVISHNGAVVEIAKIDGNTLQLVNKSDLESADMTNGTAIQMQARARDLHTLFCQVTGEACDEIVELDATVVESAGFFDNNPQWKPTSFVATIIRKSDATVRRLLDDESKPFGEEGEGWQRVGRSYAVHITAIKAYVDELKRQEAEERAKQEAELNKLDSLLAELG